MKSSSLLRGREYWFSEELSSVDNRIFILLYFPLISRNNTLFIFHYYSIYFLPFDNKRETLSNRYDMDQILHFLPFTVSVIWIRITVDGQCHLFCC